MEIINFVYDVEKLTKKELASELNLVMTEIKKYKKSELVAMLISKQNNELYKRRFYKKYAHLLALHPTKVEEMYNITPTERKRWTKLKKLKVAYYKPFKKWGKEMECPMYDAYELSLVTNQMITSWRDEHSQNVRKKKQHSSLKATITRKENIKKQQDFFKKEWKSMLKEWFSENAELGVTFQLAFWTVWLSRWAKEYQSKAFGARTHEEK